MTTKEIVMNYMKKRRKPFNSIIDHGDKDDNFEDLDLERPESLTPMEMELRIQANRVIFSLNKAISMLCVMSNIPYILENDFEIIRKNFRPKEIAFLIYILQIYDSTDAKKTDEECITLFGEVYDAIQRVKVLKAQRSKQMESDVHAVDHNLLQIINMLFTNKCIRQELKEEKAKNHVKVPYILNFITYLEELKQIARKKLFISATEEEARDRRLRQAFKSNMMLTAAIKDLEQQLETQRTQLGNELHKKVDIFDKNNARIVSIKEECQISIEKTIHESEKKMMQQCLESEQKQAALAIEAETITKQYETLLEDNFAEEKKLRAKTLRTETQLQNWLTKYDQDVGDKQTEYEEVKAQYDTEREAMDDLEDKMDAQEKMYIELMAEKEEEEERIFQEIAYKLLINRSARIIQRAWRAHIQRKRSRKRGKKGKLEKAKLRITKKDDPNAVLETKFKGDVFTELKNPDAF
ncbi:dynein regulatory complex protein 10-like [Anthonomus grandis grandis]|uniref:dynein regulatory complex protein 10-like n=1 Tax=Anthonomus grandis grandis TaxID=2921223 RepID=UPI002165C28A|nr:dynein regulatory complex protein 10-like [Anthonomus grandis grandis]